jgi:hypothetical protein
MDSSSPRSVRPAARRGDYRDKGGNSYARDRPDLHHIVSAVRNTDGLANALLLGNDELVFRFPKTEAAHALQRYGAALLAAIPHRLPIRVPMVMAWSAA